MQMMPSAQFWEGVRTELLLASLGGEWSGLQTDLFADG